jgi:predicted Zn-dependent protease
MAWALTTSGKPNEALDFVASAIRLNPIYPSHYVLTRGIALFAAGDLKQAAQVLAEGLRRVREPLRCLSLRSLRN